MGCRGSKITWRERAGVHEQGRICLAFKTEFAKHVPSDQIEDFVRQISQTTVMTWSQAKELVSDLANGERDAYKYLSSLSDLSPNVQQCVDTMTRQESFDAKIQHERNVQTLYNLYRDGFMTSRDMDELEKAQQSYVRPITPPLS